EIESAGPEEEREQMLQIVRHVGSRNRYSLGWLGELLGLAGKSIPPGEIFGVAESSFDALSYLLSFLGDAVNTVDEVFQWVGGKELDTVDSLVALRNQARDPELNNPSVGRTNSALVAEFLCKALLADLRVLTRYQRARPTPTLCLDNAHKGAGPRRLATAAPRGAVATCKPELHGLTLHGRRNTWPRSEPQEKALRVRRIDPPHRTQRRAEDRHRHDGCTESRPEVKATRSEPAIAE